GPREAARRARWPAPWCPGDDGQTAAWLEPHGGGTHPAHPLAAKREGSVRPHVEDPTMAGTPYRSHLGNIMVRLTLVLGRRVTDVRPPRGVRQAHVSAWRHGGRPVPRKYPPRLTAMLAQAIEGQTQALLGLEQEQLAVLRQRLLQAFVEIDTDRVAAVVP